MLWNGNNKYIKTKQAVTMIMIIRMIMMITTIVIRIMMMTIIIVRIMLMTIRMITVLTKHDSFIVIMNTVIIIITIPYIITFLSLLQILLPPVLYAL